MKPTVDRRSGEHDRRSDFCDEHQQHHDNNIKFECRSDVLERKVAQNCAAVTSMGNRVDGWADHMDQFTTKKLFFWVCSFLIFGIISSVTANFIALSNINVEIKEVAHDIKNINEKIGNGQLSSKIH